MRAMMLCAGKSTRLAPLGDRLPKPMLPVCDIPILRYGVALLVGHGIRDIVINLHHHGDVIRGELGDGSAFGARIRYSEEEELLETGGGLKKALPLLDPDGRDEPFVSMNGKLIFDLDLAALMEAVARDPDVLGTMVVRRVPDATAWGAVMVESIADATNGKGEGRREEAGRGGLTDRKRAEHADALGRGEDADELGRDERAGGAAFSREAGQPGRLRVRDILGDGDRMFTGVHVTRPSVVRRLPDGKACMIRQGYLPWLRAGEQVAAFEAGPVYFAEHSLPDRYLRSNLELIASRRLRHPPGPLRGVDISAHVHPTAILRHPFRIGAGAHIGAEAVVGPGAVIGAHAIVEEGAHVERAVVWPRARASGAVRDAIITWSGLVEVPAPAAEQAPGPTPSATAAASPPSSASPASPSSPASPDPENPTRS
ncbi:MAG TPA: NDP-sugar synthase [Kofleriaceae bacterium]|nr:NDP-sugar synthase [Kofleriaceae bacterium]